MKHVSLFWSIAKKWLKQYYIMSSREGGRGAGKSEGKAKEGKGLRG